MTEIEVKMTNELCFICNTESEDLRKMNEVTSKHTNTSISTILKEILGDFNIKRIIDNDINCICSDCINKIEEYDWACDIAKKQEKIICEIFLKTETLYTKDSGDDSELTENVCKKIDSSICLLPGVKAGRNNSFEFRSITIRKVIKDTKEIKCESKEIVKMEENIGSENEQEQEHEQEYDYNNMGMDSGSDFEYTPNRASKSSTSDEFFSPTTSHSKHSRKRRKKITPRNDDNEPILNEDELPTPKNRHECLYCGQRFAKKLDLIVIY